MCNRGKGGRDGSSVCRARSVKEMVAVCAGREV